MDLQLLELAVRNQKLAVEVATVGSNTFTFASVSVVENQKI